MEQSARSRASSTDPWSPWNTSDAWRLNEPAVHTGAIVLNGKAYDVPVEEVGILKSSVISFWFLIFGKSVL